MQITTRDEDFLIDAIALHRSMGEALNEVFTNPRITKVMHGADAALQWLQKKGVSRYSEVSERQHAASGRACRDGAED